MMPKIYFTTRLDLAPVVSRLLPHASIKGWKKQKKYTISKVGMSFFMIGGCFFIELFLLIGPP
jgi:hypothetical protein